MSDTCSAVAETDLLVLADTCLLLGHRLSEWCGHGPALEEDIALTNCALDLIGQARRLYQLVAARRGDGWTEDRLAYLREPEDFRNLPLAALANGDYAQTVLRAWALGLWFVIVWERLARVGDAPVAAIAADAGKEARMLVRHTGAWVVRFGDGTAESRRRLLTARSALAPRIAELCSATIAGIDARDLHDHLHEAAQPVLRQAGLPPDWGEDAVAAATLDPAEARRELLAEMQSLARTYPDATW